MNQDMGARSEPGWKNDAELFELMRRELYAPGVGDVLAASVRTAVADFRCPIDIGGVWIEPGDLVFGDPDGVVIVPRALEAEVVARALEKARGEKVVRKAIEGGMTATEAFKVFGIL